MVRTMQVCPSCGERHPDRAVLHDVRDAVHDRGRACGSAGTFERMALIGRATAGVYGSATVKKIISDTDELERQAESFPSLRGFVLDMRSEVSALLGDIDEARRLRDSANAVHGEFLGRESIGEFERSRRIETLAGDAAAAETWIRKGYELYRSFGDVAHGSTLAVYRAMSCDELGRFQDALASRRGMPRDICQRRRGQPILLAWDRGEATGARGAVAGGAGDDHRRRRLGAANRRARAPRARLFRQ
jgi:hypothetical protein